MNAGYGNAACGAERAESPMESGFSRLCMALGELEDRVMYLRGKLDPVLTPDAPEPAAKNGNGPQPVGPARSAVSHRFEGSADRAYAILNAVNGIINRVEV